MTSSFSRRAIMSGLVLAPAALAIAAIEYPRLNSNRYLARLDAMGDGARRRIERHTQETGDSSTLTCIRAVNAYLFDDEHFAGNRERYEDPRNSCLNEVLDRRTGIPISLAVVYLEVARRAGLAETATFYLEADTTPNPGNLPVGGQTQIQLPSNHLQYAITWYVLAAGFAVIYVLWHRRRPGERP